MITVADSLSRLEDAGSSGELDELCRRHGVDLLVLFGSALDKPTPRDIDVAVAFGAGRSGGLLAFIDDLADMVPGDHLDVMALDSAGPVAAHRALVPGRVLYATSPRAFFDRQSFAINHYIETKPLRDALLESLQQ